MKALIDENSVVVQVEQQEFGVAFPCFWVDCGDNVLPYKYKYENGTLVAIPEPSPEPITAEQNKITATRKLEDSDWAVLPDVNLANKSEWEAYRAALRIIARDPQEGNIDWPTKPQNIWS
jgi:hypothetical protein